MFTGRRGPSAAPAKTDAGPEQAGMTGSFCQRQATGLLMNDENFDS